ncbi:MAG: hypothetical protein JSS49_14375 [Planctomycetes bacterium]|nr:hypothetical protein [Planctomycetota bacterium]
MSKLVRSPNRWWIVAGVGCWSGWLALLIAYQPIPSADGAPPPPAKTAATSKYVVFGYSLLGMHCMNDDFSEMCILPPYNTMRAQVIDRSGEEPRIVTSGVDVRYSIPGNTSSANKTNFWTNSKALFGVALKPNVGLAGTSLKGSMKTTGNGDWAALGIPITPKDDKGKINPFQLSKIDVYAKNAFMATTSAVIPVSWEINCNLCHTTPGISVATDILRKHDTLHGTKLEASKPVLCASCHADAALGTNGVAGVKTMSHAMHGAHASRMASVASIGNTCYACHPGTDTNCQRDNHFSKGIVCTDCHGDMTAVANPTRRPWVDEPTCGSCHQKRKPNFQFEEPGKLYKDSRGHGGVYCAACHGPQHSTGPAVTAADNVQAIQKQGHAGTINTCTVCHKTQPKEPFFHKLDD